MEQIQKNRSHVFTAQELRSRAAGVLTPPALVPSVPMTGQARRSDLDLADHVNNTSYVEWVIEVVPDGVWADQELAELQIGFLSECHHGQTIASISQTTEDDRGVAVRHQLVRREDGEPAARARTLWRRSR